MASVRVAVRVRPLNKREKQLSSKGIIHVNGSTTTIQKPSHIRGDQFKDVVKAFSFDFAYDSSDKQSPTYATQEKIFLDLGTDILKAAFEGFNTCLFAYGQTGSGKSFTMMGHNCQEDKGLIPRICEGLFHEISHRSNSDSVSFSTEVSYLEIYNERVQDLLKKRTSPEGGCLRVREHPRDGPYVENLMKHLINNYTDMEDLIILGNTNRTTASTGMNDLSSRSHAIFTINLKQTWVDTDMPREILSKIHLVDLAGSERADATWTTGTRLKEGANINKSLVTLGSVISALADLNVGGLSTKMKQVFIPYRDSVLTWLLKDSLGGNSITTMVATISPAHVNYGETLSTLRYASRAKNIVNSPTVNEDNSVKVIRELRAEVAMLQRLLEEANQVSRGEPSSPVEVAEELHQNETKVLALTKEWTSNWSETHNVLQGEAVALREEGSRVILDCQLPHLIGIEKDLLGTGIILYYLKEGRSRVGSDKASCSQDIVLHGPGLLSEHCVLENHAGAVTLIPQDGALCSVNGSVVTSPCQLTQGTIIQLGHGTILRFNHPSEAAQLREKRQSGLLSAFSLSLTDLSKSTKNLSKAMLQNPGRMEEKEILNSPGVAWQQVQKKSKDNEVIKRLPEQNNEVTQHQREEEMKGPEVEENGNSLDVLAAEMESKVLNSSTTTEELIISAKLGNYPVPHTSTELDGDKIQGAVSTGEVHNQERDSCHKSRPGLMSQRPWRKAQTRVGVSSYQGEVWSGNASLQQTTVLGLGDGCGTKPEGNANKIQGVVADCYKRRLRSDGNSLGSMSHLQRRRRTTSMSVLPQTSSQSQMDKKPQSSQVPSHAPEQTILKGHFCGGEIESGHLEKISGVCLKEPVVTTGQSSWLGSLVSRVSSIVQDAGRHLWKPHSVLQQIREEGLQPFGAHHVRSLVRQSNVMSLVRKSQVFSTVKGSLVFSLCKDSHIFSILKELPLMQHIHLEITQLLQPEVAAGMIQGCNNTDSTRLLILTPTQTLSKAEEFQDDDDSGIPENICTRNKNIVHLSKAQKMSMVDVKQDDELITDQKITHVHRVGDRAFPKSKTVLNTNVQIFSQILMEFPESLSNLQTLPLQDIINVLNSVVSTTVFTPQNILALFWLTVAKCSQPHPRPALLILAETGLYTLTTDFGPLVLFSHLPLLQLKEVHIGLAGQSLRLMGTTKESILGVYTHSQRLTRKLCWVILCAICPRDKGISKHPLLHGDLMRMSLDCQVHVPDLLMDAGFRVCCQFQKRLADLIYLLHCNMDQPGLALGDVQLLLYLSVGVCISPTKHGKELSQFFLTDTHLGLVQEDAVFHPTAGRVIVQPYRPLFHNLTLRRRADVRCVFLHHEDEHGAVRVDVILTNLRAMGHPESVTEAATSPAQALNSSLHAEIWKLTFSCSTEAACLINHLSNV